MGVALHPQPVAGSLDELLDGAEDRRPFLTSDSKSGSSFERVVIDGDRYVVKHVHVDGDWTMRGFGDVGCRPVGDRAAAWVSVGGVTKLLRPGGEAYDGVALRSVTDDEIVISIDGSDETTVEKAERQGPAVTVLVGGAPPPSEPVVAGEEPESPRFSPDMSREERRAMLLERARDERARWQRDRGDRDDGEEGSPPDRNRR